MMVLSPPTSMRAQIVHDGVVWEPRPSTGPLAIASLAGGVLAAALVGAPTWFFQGPSAAGVAVPATLMLASAAMAVSGWKTQRLVVRPDRILVEERRVGRVERHELLFRELASCRVHHPTADHSHPALRLVAGDDKLLVGAGTRVEHLEWMVDVVDAALASHAEREQREGREFFFHRREPEELRRMKQRQQPEGP